MTPRGEGDRVAACSERNRLAGILDEVVRRLMWRVTARTGMTEEAVREMHSMIVERRRGNA